MLLGQSPHDRLDDPHFSVKGWALELLISTDCNKVNVLNYRKENLSTFSGDDMSGTKSLDSLL